MKNITFLSIDNQNDFTDIPDIELQKMNGFKPALSVSGAWQDALNTAQFIKNNINKINNFVLTLDTHEQYHIAHKMFWVDKEGKNPSDFTIIKLKDFNEGKWKTKNPYDQNIAKYYLEELEKNDGLALCIWPTHCLLGSVGHNIVKPIQEAVMNWENVHVKTAVKFLKGHYAYTESYGAVEADVQYDHVPETKKNLDLLKNIHGSDILIVSGQALSHCVAKTLKQIVKYLGDDFAKKIILLKDTTNPVTGFEHLADEFIKEYTAKGMLYLNCKEAEKYIQSEKKHLKNKP